MVMESSLIAAFVALVIKYPPKIASPELAATVLQKSRLVIGRDIAMLVEWFGLQFNVSRKKSMSNMPYLLQMVRNYDCDRFLQSLFVPEPVRGALLAVLALDAELAHVRAHVREEMLAHIRYAWWEESLAMIADGKKPRKHPVLLAIAEYKLDVGVLTPLVQKHRAAYPETITEDVVGALAKTFVPPKSKMAWEKAGTIISNHRVRHGKKWNAWLTIRLLCAGAGR